MRRVAFLLVVFAGGFGWVLVLFKYTIARGELWFPLLAHISEANTFFNILAFPHFIAAALYIFVFDLVLRGQEKHQLRYAFAAGLVALFLGWQHAYDLVLVYGILGAYGLMVWLRDWRPPWYLIKSGVIIGLISWWPALYSVLLTSFDPLWEEVLAQFENAGVFTPNPLGLVVLMGPTLLLALFSLIKQNPLKMKGVSNNDLFLRTWFVANFLLLYIPTDYQIHMLNGWQVPIAILATQGVFWTIIPAITAAIRHRGWSWSPLTIQRLIVVTLFLIVIPVNLYLLAWRFVDLSRYDYPFYLHQEEIEALYWLEETVEPDDVILSALTTGQFIPAYTGAHAFLAHWAQTVDFFNKRQMVYEFFTDKRMSAAAGDITNGYSVDYVFFGPIEQRYDDFDPGTTGRT
jgi:hypothetical protein